jgi:hypothetical protein
VTNLVNAVAGLTNHWYWTARNQLTNITGTVSADFLYDGLGRRVRRTVNASAEHYLHDGPDIVIQHDASGNHVVRYLRSLGIDEPGQRREISAFTTVTNGLVGMGAQVYQVCDIATGFAIRALAKLL